MKTLLYIPLDERFATRDAFINLAELTPFKVITPPVELLSQMRKPANIDALHRWIDEQISKTNILVLSAELFLYGSLINSRISKDSLQIIEKRLDKIKDYKKNNPELKIYISTVIMRIPHCSLGTEEPNFWQWCGKDIFDYSFHTHRYKVLNEAKDKENATTIKETIPEKYLEEFLWRRKRNHQITKKMLKMQEKLDLFEAIYITLDDNAPFGFNIEEEEILRKLVVDCNLLEEVNIYPGADEVGLTILAKLGTVLKEKQPKFQLVYRDLENKDLIPNYEGQALSKTIRDQIKGAGGEIVTDNGEIILLINNFSEEKQLEAGEQPARAVVEYDIFKEYLKGKGIIGFADVRYSNGGDRSFLEWLAKQPLSFDRFTYAGWNTNGNTLGTVIANSILLWLFRKEKANHLFNTIRLLEDISYQANIRNELMEYIYGSEDTVFDLSQDIDFYTRFVKKRMDFEFCKLKESFDFPYKISKVYFPMQRTFEIGICLEEN